MISSKLKKTVALAGILAATSAAAAEKIKTPAQALDQLTGPNQAQHGDENSICLSVSPYFITSMGPNGRVVGSFVSLQIDGATQASKVRGDCAMPNYETGLCERGFIKVTTTAPIQCHVPIGL